MIENRMSFIQQRYTLVFRESAFVVLPSPLCEVHQLDYGVIGAIFTTECWDFDLTVHDLGRPLN